jgi:hypothetical protein
MIRTPFVRQKLGCHQAGVTVAINTLFAQGRTKIKRETYVMQRCVGITDKPMGLRARVYEPRVGVVFEHV